MDGGGEADQGVEGWLGDEAKYGEGEVGVVGGVGEGGFGGASRGRQRGERVVEAL